MKAYLTLTLLVSTILISSVHSTSFEIKPDKSLWTYANVNHINKQPEINFCFTGISNTTKTLIIKDILVSNLNEIFKNEMTIREGIYSKEEHTVFAIYNDSQKQYYINSEFFKSFDTNKTYCLKVSCLRNPTSIKRLSLIAASTFKENSIIYSINKSFSSVEMYSTNLTNENYSLKLSGTISSSSIKLNQPFDINLTIECTLEEGKLLPVELDQVFLVLDFPNLDITKSIIKFSSGLTEAEEAALTQDSFKLKTNIDVTLNNNRIIFHSLGRDMKLKDKFNILISNLKVMEFFEGSIKVSLSAFWKNTNSLISYYLLNTEKLLTKPILSNLSMYHYEKVPFIFTNASWPVCFTFSINKVLINSSLRIFDSTSTLSFISSTCDLSDNRVQANCLQSKNNSEMLVQNLNLFEDEIYRICVWVLILQKPSSNNVILLNLNAQMIGETEIFNFNPSFKIKNGIKNEGTPVPNQCITDNKPVNCNDNTLIYNENSGNFLLLENDVTSILNYDVFEPRKLYDFKSLNSNYFRISWRLNLTTLAYGFAGDWKEYQNLITQDSQEIIRGNHNLYFPPSIYISSLNNVCKLSWISNYQANPTGVYTGTPQNYKNELSMGGVDNFNFENKFQSSGLVSENKLSFSNYRIEDTATLITKGFFHHLVQSIACNSDFTVCLKVASGNSTPKNNFTLQLATNCFYHKDNYEFKWAYQPYDFIHMFSRDSSNSSIEKLIRANRWVSLLPQPGIFKLTKDNESTTRGIWNESPTMFRNYPGEAVCILELNFDSEALQQSFYNQNTILKGYLNGIEVLEFNDMTNYPVNKHSLKVAKNNVQNNNLTLDQSILQADFTHEFGIRQYNSSKYTFYLGDELSFSLDLNLISDNTENKASIVFFPVKCNPQPQFSLSFSGIEENNIANSLHKQYNLIKAYDNPTMLGQYRQINNIPNTYGENQVIMQASWEDFVFQKNTKVKFVQKSETNYANYNPNNIGYLVLLTKDDITSDERLLDKDDVEVKTSNYLQLYSKNAFILNGVMFNFIMIKDRINNLSSSNFNFKSNYFKFGFQGIPIHQNPNTPVSYNDIAVFVNVNSTDLNTNLNPGYIISNYDGSDYLVTVPPAIKKINDELIVKIIDYTTKDIKLGEGSKTACGVVEILIQPYVLYFEIYSQSITPRTITEGQGFNGEFIYNENMVKGKAPLFTDFTVNNYIKLSLCNLDVSISKRFSIFKIVQFFKDSNTKYINYELTDTQVTKNIDSTQYNHSRLVSWEYGNKRNGYGQLTLAIENDFEIFRNMKMTIEADLSSLSADDYLKPTCSLQFKISETTNFDLLWETCFVDIKNNKIVITTFNEVLIHESIPKNFFLFVNLLKVTDLSSIAFTIRPRFNENTSFALFPEVSSIVDKEKNIFQLDSFKNMDISNRASIISLLPLLPLVPGMIDILLKFENDLEIKTYIDTNSIIVNEIRLNFPVDYYGPVPGNLKCYINELQIENCSYDGEMIMVRTTLDISKDIKIGIYGYKIPSSDDININRSVILFNISNRKTFTRDVYFYGKTRLPENFDRTIYIKPSTSNTANLRQLSASFSNLFPGETSNVTLKFTLDPLAGYNSDFSVNIDQSYLYLELPEEISLASSDGYLDPDKNKNPSKLTLFVKYIKFNKLDETSTPSQSLQQELVKEAIPLSINYLGNIIYTKINYNLIIDKYLREFELTLTNLTTPQQQERIGVFKYQILRKNEFLLKNFDLLNTSIAQSNLLSNSQRKLEIEQLEFIEFHRGVEFVYSNSKYYFNLDYDPILKPGIYGLINLQVNSNTNIPSANTTITLNSQNNQIQSLEAFYNVDGRQNRNATIFAGVSCGIYPGRYILKLTTSNKDNFHNVPNVVFTISNFSQKNTIKFYSDMSLNIGTEYFSNESIVVGRGGFVYFWVKPDNINMESMIIEFTPRINLGTTVPPPANINIKEKNPSFVMARFDSPDPLLTAKQYYNIIVKNNQCFESNLDLISFNPNLIIQRFEDFEIKLSDFIMQNADTKINLEGIEENIPSNVVYFHVNYDRAGTIPIPSNIYCALYCGDRPPLTKNQITEFPRPKTDWYINFFYKQLKTSDRFVMKFENLIRDQKYKLQCYLETAVVDTTKRSSIMKNYDDINGMEITAATTPILDCVVLKLNSYSSTIAAKAQNLLQEAFYPTFNEDGCLLAISSDNKVVDGYNSNSFDCENTIDYKIFSDVNKKEIGQISQRIENLRFLQNNSTIVMSNDTNTDTNYTNSIITQIYQIEDPNIKICLVQHKKCKNKITQTSRINKILASVLEDQIVYVKKSQSQNQIPVNSTRVLQVMSFNNTIVNDNYDNKLIVETRPSLLREILTKEENLNYLGFEIRNIDPEFDFNQVNLNITYSSDFKVTIEDNIKYTSYNLIFNGVSDKVKCWWALNKHTSASHIVTVKELFKCNINTNLFCGKQDGQDVPSSINIKIDTSKIVDKEYGLWITCKQNYINSRLFTNPKLALRLVSYHEDDLQVKNGKENSLHNYIYECKQGHKEFPDCCRSAKFDKQDPSICNSNIVNLSLFNLIMICFVLLFN